MSKRGPYGKNADTSLVVEGVEVLVQRELLACMSPYFNTLLVGNFKESKLPTIELKELSLSTLYDCLDIMHGHALGYLSGTMAIDRLSALFLYADRLDIDVVRRYCEMEMSFSCEGQEIDRYLLACHYSLDHETKARHLKLVTQTKLREWTSEAATNSDQVTVRQADMAALIATCNNWKIVTESSAPEPQNGRQDSLDKRKYGKCDTTLKVDKTIIQVDRCMLSYHSEYFEKLLLDKKTIFELPNENVTVNALIHCLDILYGRKIGYRPGYMSYDALYQILTMASFFQINSIFLFCCMELLIPFEGCEIFAYLTASNFQLPKCKAELLTRLKQPMFHEVDVMNVWKPSTSPSINLSIDDLRNIFTISSGFDNHNRYIPHRRQTCSPKQPKSALPKDGMTFSQKTANILLVVGTEEFGVNRMVMASHSTVLYELLVVQGKGKKVFDILHVDPRIFRLCL